MLRGFADVHAVHAIVQALHRRGMDVVTAQQRGLHEADDSDLLAAALAGERVMLTNATVASIQRQAEHHQRHSYQHAQR